MNVHFLSQTDNWATPQSFFDKVSERFGGFQLDAAASNDNKKCDVFFDDALNKRWALHASRIWLNPPYGRSIGKFMAKAAEAANDGALVVCLVPSRTDTTWWHDHVMPSAKVEFIRGRLKFGNATNSAPFPSALVIYDGRKQEGPMSEQ